MLKFPLDPSICLIVNAFNQTSTLRGAAALLGVDPPALVRKVQRISEEHGYLQKNGNRWSVTESGRRVAAWTDEIVNSQKVLLDERPRVRIAAFTWLAEEMLIPHFDRLQVELGKSYLWSFNMTAGNLETELIQGRTDFVIQGHAPTDPSVAYRKIKAFPWIAIAPIKWRKEISRIPEKELSSYLMEKPFIRHTQVNPTEALGFKISQLAPLAVDSVIGVRSGVANGIGWGIVPTMATQSLIKDDRVLHLNMPTNIEDHVSVWWLRSRKDLSRAITPLYRWISSFPVA